jgi:hypothetical protein
MLLTAAPPIAAPSLTLPDRFRMEIVYFMTPPGDRGAPKDLADNEYWIDLAEARQWLDEGVVYVVSPLDAENQAEIELTEYHEAFLQWLLEYKINRVRISSDLRPSTFDFRLSTLTADPLATPPPSSPPDASPSAAKSPPAHPAASPPH